MDKRDRVVYIEWSWRRSRVVSAMNVLVNTQRRQKVIWLTASFYEADK